MWSFPQTEADVLALDLQVGDHVASWRPNVFIVEPNVVPGGVAATYTATLEGRDHSATVAAGSTLNDVAAALSAVLLADQTDVAVFVSGWTLVLYGPLGRTLTLTLSANLSLITEYAASQRGSPGALEIIRVQNFFTVERMVTVAKVKLNVRRRIEGKVNWNPHASTHPYFEIVGEEVRTLLKRK